MSRRPCLSLNQVAEIHRASKDGQLYDVGGNTRNCSAQAQPPEPTEYDIRPASQVYSVSSVLASTPNLGLGKASRPLSSARAWPLAFSWRRSPGPRRPAADPPASLCSPHSCALLSLTALRCPAGSLPPHSQEPTSSAIPGPAHECPHNPFCSSQLKPKRVGAGFPRGSCSFQTATELMEKMWAEEQAPQPVWGGEQEPPSQPHSLQGDSHEPLPGPRGEALGSSAHCGGSSPEKKVKSPSKGGAKARASKKQQLLAAAALKDSQNIARFCQRARSPSPLPSAPGAEGAGPSCEGVQGPPAAPEKCTREDGALGCLAALPQTKECTGERPR